MKLKEVTRDLLALGSIPFLLIVLIRVLMVDNYNQFLQITIASLLVFIFAYFKKLGYHISILIILAIFTSVFYNDYLYTTFAAGITIASLILFRTILKKEKILFEIFAGLGSSLVSYLISLRLNIPNL